MVIQQTLHWEIIGPLKTSFCFLLAQMHSFDSVNDVVAPSPYKCSSWSENPRRVRELTGEMNRTKFTIPLLSSHGELERFLGQHQSVLSSSKQVHAQNHLESTQLTWRGKQVITV